jgi:peptide deformylase
MAILKVARLGHPVLRHKASDIELADIRSGRFNQLIEDMFETMYEYVGVGLAGPQVHLPLRVFVYELQEEAARRKKSQPARKGVFFNSTLEYVGDKKIVDFEGCLSVPFLGGEVPRYESVILRGYDEKGEPAEVRMDGYIARIFQHEIDHTDGHVYLDRMPDLTTLSYTVTL